MSMIRLENPFGGFEVRLDDQRYHTLESTNHHMYTHQIDALRRANESLQDENRALKRKVKWLQTVLKKFKVKTT